MVAQTEKQSTSNKKKAILAGSLAGLMALGGTVAFFTDRVETDANATAGTVDLSLVESWEDVANFNPGDKADLNYTINNDGNKSVDVRERIVVHSSVAMNTGGQAEFEVYKASDVEPDGNGAYKPKSGAQPITAGVDRIVADDNQSITYEIAEYTLNGTGNAAEVEDGISKTSHASEYVLVFKDSASNAFQGADVTVDLVTEAKQHRNTGDDTWAVVSSESLTAGGQALNVVPVR